ncbi:MAG: hypothetical protein ACR2RV_20580 [Verrucomicrobiales bacterium]
MSDDLDDIIARARRVVRVRGVAEDEVAMPPGFADRVARSMEEKPTQPATLILWHRLSFAGVAVACALTVASALTFRNEGELRAPDPWLDMPMSSTSDEFEEGGLVE